jgi:RNA polymerase sigma-70 factor (ECF subfamily)
MRGIPGSVAESTGELPDDDLIREILNGNADRYRVLVERYQRPVYGMARRFFKDGDDADDFVQEIFVKAYVGLNGFRGRSSFYTWLMRIAYNAGVNSVKRAKPTETLGEEEIDATAESPERIHLKREMSSALNEAIAELPERYAACVDLYFYYGATYAEISEITEIPLNTVKSDVFRAKKLLRKRLSGTAAEDGYDLR